MPTPVEFSETEIDGVLEVKTRVFWGKHGFFSETRSKAAWEEAGVK